MSSQNQGRQSPEPERQSGSQQQSAPSDGQGVSDNTSNKETSQKELENLESNPVHILEEHAKATVSKTVENTKS